MVYGLNLLFQFLDSFAFIVLAGAGLAIIFGIMGVINLAHGEFIMIGAYATTLSYHELGGLFGISGVALIIAMFMGVFVTTLFGVAVERTIIKQFYDRLLDSMVATWGISLITIQGMRIVFGNSLNQIGTPLGSIAYGNFSYSLYRVLLAGVSIVILAGVYWLFTHTDYGIRARATIQNEEMAQTLGVDTERTYMTTFALGSALAGLTGALYAPTVSIVPGMGSSFLVEAFVAVVVGGPSVVLGTTLAGGLLGFINAFFSNVYGTFFGRIALLVTAIVMIRFLPDGITGLINHLQDRRQEVS